jgi:hypothetical protein
MPAFIPFILEVVLPPILEAVGLAGAAVTVLNFIKGILAPGGTPINLGLIETEVDTIYADVQSSTFGLALIAARLVTMESAILTALGTPQQAGVAVTLPSPPAGYGGLSGPDTALAVWNYVLPALSVSTASALSDAWELGENLANSSWLNYAFAPYFWWEGGWNHNNLDGGPSVTPQPLASTILATDTLITWLNREVPTITWTMGYQGADFAAGRDPAHHGYWICKLNPADWAALKATVVGVSGSAIAPVWPGSGFATLGSSVAISPGLTITTPMDGVIVNLSSVPTVRGFYEFDDLRSYRNVGALTFLTDAGEAEYPQGLGFTSAMYCPKLMKRAAAVKVRAVGGVVGTVTPWLTS